MLPQSSQQKVIYTNATLWGERGQGRNASLSSAAVVGDQASPVGTRRISFTTVDGLTS
jgi:hypothetical protein